MVLENATPNWSPDYPNEESKHDVMIIRCQDQLRTKRAVSPVWTRFYLPDSPSDLSCPSVTSRTKPFSFASFFTASCCSALFA